MDAEPLDQIDRRNRPRLHCFVFVLRQSPRGRQEAKRPLKQTAFWKTKKAIWDSAVTFWSFHFVDK